MEIYLITKDDCWDKVYLFATHTREEAEKIKNYLNNHMIEKRGMCDTSMMVNIETIPSGTFDDYMNKEIIIRDIIFERTQELELLKNKLDSLFKNELI